MMIKILSPSQEHYPKWSQLMQQYFDFYNFSHTPEHLAKVFALLMDQKNNLHSFLLADADNIVGVSNYIFMPDTFALTNCYLSDLYIHPDYRGQGHAQKLIEAVRQHAAQNGCSSFYWLTATDNTTAQKVYDKIARRGDWLVYEKSTSIP